jgi:arylformamidase
VGTHVDAPLHFIPGGASIEHLPLAAMIGPAYVADLRMTSQITADTLSNARIPAGTVRLLLHTTNSERWSRDLPFTPDFVALSPSAAAWIVDHEIALLGVDYLSVQRFRDGPETHQILLDAGVVIVEGLDLSQPEAGEYELIVLPIKLAGAEGAPARAVIRR